jgi:hypothetical protein
MLRHNELLAKSRNTIKARESNRVDCTMVLVETVVGRDKVVASRWRAGRRGRPSAHVPTRGAREEAFTMYRHCMEMAAPAPGRPRRQVIRVKVSRRCVTPEASR